MLYLGLSILWQMLLTVLIDVLRNSPYARSVVSPGAWAVGSAVCPRVSCVSSPGVHLIADALEFVSPGPRIARWSSMAARLGRTAQQLTLSEPTAALESLVGDSEVLKETERLQLHEAVDDVVIVRGVSLLKSADFGKEALNVLTKVSFGVRPGA